MSMRFKSFENKYMDITGHYTADKGYVLVECPDEYSEKWLEKDFLLLTNFNVAVFTGFITYYDMDEEDFFPDDILHSIYDVTTGELIYEEINSSMRTCIYNFCRFFGYKKWKDQLDNLTCSYQFDNGNFIKEKIYMKDEDMTYKNSQEDRIS